MLGNFARDVSGLVCLANVTHRTDFVSHLPLGRVGCLT